jgi:hypothetical protein
MPIPSTTKSLEEAWRDIRAQAQFSRLEAQNALSTLGGTVDADWVFQLLIQMRNFINTSQTWTVPGIDAYVDANVPNYSGVLSTDITAASNAAQAVITWVFTNFPKDAQGFIQAHKLNADGTKIPATFTSAQTAGLQTALTNFVAALG